MPTGKNVVAESQGLYKLFNFDQPSKAEYDGKMLRITERGWTAGGIAAESGRHLGSRHQDTPLTTPQVATGRPVR